MKNYTDMIGAPKPCFIDSRFLLCLKDLPTRQRDLFSQWMKQNGLLKASKDANYADYMIFSYWFQHHFLPHSQFNPEELI